MEEIIILGFTFELLPQKVIFWKEEKTLLIADTHFGKALHFRKNGIPIPDFHDVSDLLIIKELIESKHPKQIIFLGDLFHSVKNEALHLFLDFLGHYPNIDFILIKGNHDIIPAPFLYAKNLSIVPKYLDFKGFRFIHEFIPNLIQVSDNAENKSIFHFSGHIHPAVRLSGKGKQSISVPIFYKTEHNLTLPAFGGFTGTFAISPKLGDEIWAIAGNKVIRV